MKLNTNMFISSNQQRNKWLCSGNDTLTNRISICIKIKGKLDKELLFKCLESIVSNEESIRSKLYSNSTYSYPLQKIEESKTFLLEISDLKFDIEEYISERQEFVEHPFIAILNNVGEDSYLLTISTFDLFTDIKSLANIFDQLTEIYFEGGLASSRSTQYVDYTMWQAEKIKENKDASEYWDKSNNEIKIEKQNIKDKLSIRFDSRIDKLDFIASCLIILSRMDNTNKSEFNIILDGRVNPSLEKSIGLFERSLPINYDIEYTVRIDDFKEKIKTKLLNAEAHQLFAPANITQNDTLLIDIHPEYKFVKKNELLFEISEIRRPPLRESLCISLSYSEKEGSLITVTGEDQIFHDIYLKNLIDILTDTISLDDNVEIGQVPLISTERALNLEVAINSRERKLTETSFIDVFVKKSSVLANKTAVKINDASYTYGELNKASNKLAYYLQEKGINSGDVVGVFFPRNYTMMVSLLAIMKIGATYSPIDPQVKKDRLDHILKGVSSILVDEEYENYLENKITQNILTLNEEIIENLNQPDSNLNKVFEGSELAYILYTSGSTGVPKGVKISHLSLINYLSYAANNYFSSSLNTIVYSSVGFDLTVTSLFAPLLVGGEILLIQENQLEYLKAGLIKNKVTDLLKVTPSHLKIINNWIELGELENTQINNLVIGGEPLKREDLRKILDYQSNINIFNEYGPTEATVGCTVEKIDLENFKNSSIGLPLDNYQIYILDEQYQQLPVGLTGEIFIGGIGLSSGYYLDKELTAKKFVTCFVAGKYKKLYATGDLGRLVEDGKSYKYEFIGRNDRQVKIRGYRVELDEIERVLSSLTNQNVVVTTKKNKSSELSLITFICGKYEHTSLVDQLKVYLPDHMIPDKFYNIDEIPVNVNGKVDFNKLLDLASSQEKLIEYIAPRTKLEKSLTEIWQNCLKIVQIGINDNFFSLGGDSIRMIQVIGQLKHIGIEISTEEIFKAPTIALLASEIESILESNIELKDINEDEITKSLIDELVDLTEEEVTKLLDEAQ